MWHLLYLTLTASSVTGLARLRARIFFCVCVSVHMRNFRLVDRRDRNSRNKTKGATQSCIVRNCRSFVYPVKFTNEANSQTSEVKIHTGQNDAGLFRSFQYYESKAILSGKYFPGYPGWGAYTGRLARSWL